MKNCINCKERHLGCHDNCEKYKNDIEENKIIKEEQKKFNNVVNFENRLKGVYGIVYGR